MTSTTKSDEKKTKCPDDKPSTEYETVSSTALEEPFVKKFASLPGEETLPSYENDYCRAKAYLMRQCTETGDNLPNTIQLPPKSSCRWDHLNDVLKKILIEQPRNIGDTFEEFSFRVREARFRDQTDHLRDIFVPPEHHDLSLKLLDLLRPMNDNLDNQDKREVDEEQVHPNLMELLYFFEQAGVGLPRQELFYIALHIKKFVATHSIEKYRFWGKILGLEKNYYILETELSEEETAKRNAERKEDESGEFEESDKEAVEREELKEKREREMEEAKLREIEFAAERSQAKNQELIRQAQERGLKTMPEPVELPPWPPIPPIPLPPSKSISAAQTRKCPSEPTGVGVNKKTYFVCSEPGDEWIELPDATPEQIVAARKIKRAFIGNLDAQMNTYPGFPGTEQNYLRAQIARISSGTQISPLGFYTFNEEEDQEADDEGVSKTNYMENPDYEPVSVKDLTDPSLSFWVHHTPYILQQGRTTWWNPAENETEGEDEDEEKVIVDETEERETGPELLTPLSEDAAIDSIIPWSARITSALFPEFAIAIIRSNLWPGAYAFATNKKFENVYIGNGQKFSPFNHSPELIKDIQDEYPTGPEILEILDPTPEDEEEWRLAHEVAADEEEEVVYEEEAEEGEED